jgi:hypothetical protein
LDDLERVIASELLLDGVGDKVDNEDKSERQWMIHVDHVECGAPVLHPVA